jgi:hypothetical protein
VQLDPASAPATTDSDSVLRAFVVSIGLSIVSSADQPGFSCDSVEWNVLNHPRNFSKSYLPRYFLLLLVREVFSGARCVPFWIFEFVCIKGARGAGGPRARSVVIKMGVFHDTIGTLLPLDCLPLHSKLSYYASQLRPITPAVSFLVF